MAITLARVHFKCLDDPARVTGADSTALMDAAEMEALELCRFRMALLPAQMRRTSRTAPTLRSYRAVCQRPLTMSRHVLCQRVRAMGWISNDYEHEGWATAVAPDGRMSASSTGEGMLVKGITGHYKPDKMLPDYEVVPDSEIIGWRGACECGWRGELWEHVTSPAAADFSRRRDYLSPDDFAHASSEVENAIHDEWKAHLAPLDAVAGMEAAAR